MSDSLFKSALNRTNSGRPPVWFMRQAGRYHSHYQALRKKYSFEEVCKIPEVAAEATLGPIRDFDFDAAILFSDLLFPLEVMGMGLKYDVGPQLAWKLHRLDQLKDLSGGAELAEGLAYQGQAMKLIRKALPASKGLLGFVGGPLTLFVYAAEGTHKGELSVARQGLRNGLFAGFSEKLRELLAENMALQFRGGSDCIAILDTCAGEVDVSTYREIIVPELSRVLAAFRKRCPDAPVIYYSKGTTSAYWDCLLDLPIQGIGIDWHSSLPEALKKYSGKWAVQGNVDPNWMLEPWANIEPRVRSILESVRALPAENRRGWVCGLGHGILPKTPEENVRNFIRMQREIFS